MAVLIAAGLALGGTLAAPVALAAARPPAVSPTARARTLNRWALEIVNRWDCTVEERQRAQRYLEEALALEPRYSGHWLVLGRLRERGEEDRLARGCYLRAIALAPLEPEARTRLAKSWKREWLRVLDATALDRAIAQFDTVTRLRPYGSPAWLGLVPLRYENGELGLAAQAAERALAGRPRLNEAPLAAAYTSFRRGDIERSDSLFRAAIPTLDPDLRALFEDPSRILHTPATRNTGRAPVYGAPAGDSLLAEALGAEGAWSAESDSAAGSRAVVPHPLLADSSAAPGAAPFSVAAFVPALDDLDPDPTTTANELMLEYWSRIAHAYFLLSDPRYQALDARAETYIRYGPPASVHLNPPGVPLYWKPNPRARGRSTSMTEFPLDALRLDYPELGMFVLLHDRSLTGQYTQPVSQDWIPGTLPDARALARRPDLVALGKGHAVFPTLPPSAQRLDVRGMVSAFEGGRGPRLLVQARVPGAPGDSLIARWVARDSTGREVARGRQSPAVSACDPAEFRIAEFAAELPPGRYDIAVSVRDTALRRGLFRTRLSLAPAGRVVALSDLVLCCGDPSLMAELGVRIEADMDATVIGARPLVAYFEIYHLAPDRDGASRFRYEYEVKRWTDDRNPRAMREAARRPPVDRWVSRDETHAGATRRQFVRVPITSLLPGRYLLRVRVRDLVNGAEADRVAEFVRE